MDRNQNYQPSARLFGPKRLLLTGLPFFAAGCLMAYSFQGPPASIASNLQEQLQSETTVETVIPGSFAELADRLSPSVVNVKVTKVEKADFNMNHPQLEQFGDFFGRFFDGVPQMPRDYRSQGAGSGVIISDDGYILTNNHVVENAKEVTITMASDKELTAEVIGRDPKTDLAVLKVNSTQKLPAAKLGDSESLQVGDWVVAIGNPFGLNHTVTSGIVSAKGRVIGAGPYDDFIQTDASINPGNSGGPLFNMKGEVVGINTAIIPQGQGIGFAIPISTAKPLIPQLVDHGEITRGYLGVNIQSITDDLAKALDIEGSDGALVADVVDGSPADEGGLKRGDIIIDFNGDQIKESRDLPVKVAATPVGEEVDVTVIRDGKEKTLAVVVGELSADATASTDGTGGKGKWGMQLHELSPELEKQLHIDADKGVAVVGVAPGSAAAEAGIRSGDVIVEVNKKPVDSIKDVKEQIRNAKDKDRLLLLVKRQDGTLYVPLEQQG